jgi:rhodanese-related sulfurtransferase
MPIMSLGPKAAHAAMGAGPHCFIDVRTVEEFNAGHPAGAVNVPIATRSPAGQMAPNPDFVPSMKKLAQPGTKIFASCQAGMRSMNACQALEQAGYGNLVNIEGGFGGRRGVPGKPDVPGWRDAGLPVESTASTYGAPKA